MSNVHVAVAVRAAIEATPVCRSDFPPAALLVSLLTIGVAANAQDVNMTEAVSVPVPIHGAASSDAAAGQETRLEEVVVSRIRFKDSEPISALKLPIAVKDTPMTIMAVTGDVIDFAGIKTFEDVYKVDASGGSSHSLDSFPRNFYRGFLQQGNNAIRIDGFRMPADVQLDLEPYDRFEIVKGATSTLYGQNPVAGTLNAISKNPRDVFGGELSAEGGSFDHKRVTGDFYGPLADDSKLQYRVVGVWMDEDSFLDVAGKNVKLIAPTLKYQFDDATSVTARINYQEQRLRYHFGNGPQCLCDDISLAQPGDFVMRGVDRSTFFGQNWNRANKDALFAQGALEHRFVNDWNLRVGLQSSKIDEYSANALSVSALRNGESQFTYLYTDEKEDSLYAGEVQLYGDVELFGTRNTLFFGVDYQHQKSDILQGVGAEFTGFNIFEPRYDLSAPHLRVSDYATFSQNHSEIEEYGLTAQVFLRPIDGLTLQVGARYSDAKLSSDRRDMADTTLEEFRNQPFGRFQTDTRKTTVQLGTTYALTPTLNLYASYGETFVPRVGVFVFDPDNPLGRTAPPEQGKAYEIGLKGDWLDQRISYSLAAFDMKRTNLTQPRPGSSLEQLLGTQQSRGVELEMQGAITPAWNVFLSAASMDPKYQGGVYDGLQSANGAKFGLSLFSSYEIQQGPLQGLGFGGGVVHKSGRKFFGTDLQYANGDYVVFDFGAFTEVDARIFYNTDSWRFQLSSTNLFNEKYYSPSRDVLLYGVHVNPPRAFEFKITRMFGSH